MRFQSHLNTAVNLIRQYNGSMPLSHYLKQYFAQHKKHGSKDRKYIAHLCYCYYRTGHAFAILDVEESIKTSLFLCNAEAGEWQVLFKEEWLKNWNKELAVKISFIKTIYPYFYAKQIFPFGHALSETIDATAFSQSHLIQPDLFLRIRPGKKEQVIEKLKAGNIIFNEVANGCLALASTTKIETILLVNKEVVVQDYSSQKIQAFLQLQTINHKPLTSVWDCCAASGGKSILAIDTLKNIMLTVSDIRPSIMNNLKKRFAEAGIKKYNSFIADLTKAPLNIQYTPFDLIICDAPCSGSGTWGRTPEQLFFFNEEKIKEYADLQKKIVQNVITKLDKHGYFLYITCSVFKQENEEVAAFICNNCNMQLVKQELIKGYDKKADTMFAALFTRVV